ncbi:MAG: anti-sigma factor [Planctomycetota bacterium]
MNASNPHPETNPDSERLLELLADHALGELTPAEREEMNTLLQDHPELQDDALEEAAALLLVAEAVGPGEASMPAGLSERLTADAEAFVQEAAPGPANADDAPPSGRSSGSAVLGFIGGVLATAAAVGLYFGVLSVTSSSVSPAGQQAYAQYMQSHPEAVQIAWAGLEADYQQVAGEVAWSGKTQDGYMVFDGLPANDPAEAQYQLWIVDPTRDEFPVDGGVFNVADHLAADGKAYVPIDAKLRVDQPAAFALTLEKPGGVVKSNNALLVVAAVQ